MKPLLLSFLLLLSILATSIRPSAAARVLTASAPAAGAGVGDAALPAELMLASLPPELLASLPKDFDPSSLPPDLVAGFVANVASGKANVTEILANLPPIPNLKELKLNLDLPDFSLPPVQSPKIPSLREMVPPYLSFLVPKGL